MNAGYQRCYRYTFSMTSVGLVLGGGGVTGAAYEMAALMAIELATGWSPNDADVVIGTSAGSFVASLLHKPLALNAELRGRQVRNMVLLALAFFVLFYTFPAGMVLYWTTNNLISVIKSLWANR